MYQICIAVSVIVGSAVAIIRTALAVLEYRRKDRIWDTALQLTRDSNGYHDADEFARQYVKLKAFQRNGCTLKGQLTIEESLSRR